MQKYKIDSFVNSLKEFGFQKTLNFIKEEIKTEEIEINKEELKDSILPLEIKQEIEKKIGFGYKVIVIGKSEENEKEILNKKEFQDKKDFIKREILKFIKEEFASIVMNQIEEEKIKNFSIETGSIEKLIQPIMEKYPSFKLKKKEEYDSEINKKEFKDKKEFKKITIGSF